MTHEADERRPTIVSPPPVPPAAPSVNTGPILGEEAVLSRDIVDIAGSVSEPSWRPPLRRRRPSRPHHRRVRRGSELPDAANVWTLGRSGADTTHRTNA